MKRNTKTIAVLLLVLVFLAIITHDDGTTSAIAQSQPAAQADITESAVYLSTSTLPVSVSGIVTAVDEATLRAQVAGVVETLAVSEGQLVTAGAVLARQSVPVSEAERALRQAEQELTALQQSQAVAHAELSSEQVQALSYSAAEIARLRSEAAQTRTNEAMSLALTATESALVTAVSTADFVSNNRSLFTADGLATYDTVLAELYGLVPNHFRGPFLRGRVDSADLLAEFRTLREQDELTAIEVQTIAMLTQTQLEELSSLLLTAEADVFDKARRTSERVDEYIATRRTVLTELANVQTAMSQLQQSIDTALQDSANQQTNVIVTAKDTALANLQAEYARLLREQSAVVSTAMVNMSSASVSLSEVRAPFAGVVTDTLVKRGDTVMPGEPLVRVAGTDGREVEVVVPSVLRRHLQIGDPFVIDGTVVGYIDRFSPHAQGGATKVTVSITSDIRTVGESISGQIRVSPDSELYRVPRQYVQFDSDGPYIAFANEMTSRVRIVHDAGTHVFITANTVHEAPLVSAQTVSL